MLDKPAEFHLTAGYSSKGCGYPLLAGSHKKGNLIEINSRGSLAGGVSSYLGELHAICWAPNKTRSLVQGKKLVLWTGSESAFKRIKNCEGDPKCLYDVRVARLLAWLLSKFTNA